MIYRHLIDLQNKNGNAKQSLILKKLLFMSFILSMLCGCEKNHFSFYSKERILVENTWEMTSFINHTENTAFAVTDYAYRFNKDGSMLVIDKDSVQHETSWKFSDNNEYLNIGSNIYKLKILTNKLMGLQYGSIDIFYEPVD